MDPAAWLREKGFDLEAEGGAVHIHTEQDMSMGDKHGHV